MIEVRVYGEVRKSLSKASVFIETGQEKIRHRELIAKLPCGQELVKKEHCIYLR